ncbi:hypothetical protein ACLMJK_008719 [Lecanora helva]
MCATLFWNEESYRSVNGARAVELIDNPDNFLTYCEASDQTLAVSHVWNHGQGGRPELCHGFKHCLHRRYIAIAKSLGFNSYRMDTPCIPNDHELRGEAISKINEVSENSKAIVIYDRDLTEIDARDLSIEKCELILLVTVMICDWSLRAWTFLEVFRGRRSIFVMCKDNITVSLKQIVELVYRKGSIDIALLLLSLPHLLPSGDGKDIKHVGNAFEPGFMTVETAGSLLSQRAASRPGDDMVIWSLLIRDRIEKLPKSSWMKLLINRDPVIEQAKALWRYQLRQGRGVNTSFLLSSAPRLESKGLKWAPSSPTAQLTRNPRNGKESRLLALDGTESIYGLITKSGFKAQWLYHDFYGGMFGAKQISS